MLSKVLGGDLDAASCAALGVANGDVGTAYSNAGETTRRRQLREAAVEAFPADESVELGVTRVVGADGADAPARSLQAGGT